MHASLLTDADREQLAAIGIGYREAEHQLRWLFEPPPPIRLARPCTLGDGVERLGEAERPRLRELAHAAARAGRFAKFVPASGAASRMFRPLAAYLSEGAPEEDELLARRDAGDPTASEILAFASAVSRLALRHELAAALAARGHALDELLAGGRLREVAACALGARRLDWARRPKALLAFHDGPEGPRDALTEQLAEGVAYLRDAGGVCRYHFTIPPGLEARFAAVAAAAAGTLAERLAARFEVGFSSQDPATDTLALDDDEQLARTAEGRLVLRPGGHGALLGNLAAAGFDIAFVKNIDNVLPEREHARIGEWQELLAGRALAVEERLHALQRALADGALDGAARAAALGFLADALGVAAARELAAAEPEPQLELLRREAYRPLRVCGVVRNTGEPGGGPFWVRGPDGAETRQIVESSQVDFTDPAQRTTWAASTHFNPVQLVCCLRDAAGRPYDLERFVDPATVLRTRKSEGGRELVVLERPGLWNGAMAGWHTLFVEVPEELFAPVKTVLDLAREAHQA